MVARNEKDGETRRERKRTLASKSWKVEGGRKRNENGSGIGGRSTADSDVKIYKFTLPKQDGRKTGSPQRELSIQ